MAKGTTSSYPSLFQPCLGCYKDNTFSPSVDPSVSSKFCKARPVSYALRAKVDAELDRLQAEIIITPIKYSDWASAICEAGWRCVAGWPNKDLGQL